MNNPSGIWPVEHKVLIDPMPVEEKIGSILLPDESKEREQFAQMKGRIVAVSPFAFDYAEYGDQKPQPDTLVLFAKYAGVIVRGKDGKEYRLVNDQDICATIEE